SQGPIFLQQLALLDGFDLEGMDPLGTEFVHVVTECAKLAFADREAFYGDPDFVTVPLATLLSAPYNDERRRLVARQASRERGPGSGPGMPASIAEAVRPRDGKPHVEAHHLGDPTRAKGGERRGASSGDTCHLDVIDRHGNMISATPSGGWLQSSP